MKYVIYQLVAPEFLKVIEPDAYYTKTIRREILQELDVMDVNGSHDSMDSAIAEIHNKADKLKHLSLTILPVYRIFWDGTVG